VKAFEYLVVEIGGRWEVRLSGKLEPLATYPDQDSALAHAYEAAWVRQTLDGAPVTVRKSTAPMESEGEAGV